MKNIPLLLAIIMALCTTSCEKFGATPGSLIRTLLPGECLASTELSYYLPDGEEQQVENNRFVFAFTLDLSGHKMEKADNRIWALRLRVVPSNGMYKAFGANRKKVKNEFEKVFEEFSESVSARFHVSRFSVVTLLYNGGISLVANREFAGIPAGENLASLMACTPEDPVITSDDLNTLANAGGLLGIPLDYISIASENVVISIPMGEHKLIKEAVTFELEIPVKAVQYLTWLNDKLTDPDAPVPYKNEVLHCRFTTNYGLR